MKLNTYLALFRGINVGGKNILPMKDLLELVTQLGVQKARTYIQSGNLVFDAKPADCATIEQQIRLAIKARFGFEPAIILIGAKQLAQIIEASPFSSTEEQAQSAHFGFLSKPATQADMQKLEKMCKESERFVLTEQVFYLFAPEGLGQSKLAAGAEKALGVQTTFRNFRTVLKLGEMVSNRV